MSDQGQFEGDRQQSREQGQFSEDKQRNQEELHPVDGFWKRIFMISLLVGTVIIAGIYLILFDSMSETTMVQVSFTWITLVVFGATGLVMTTNRMKGAIFYAILFSILAMGALQVFFNTIWPLL